MFDTLKSLWDNKPPATSKRAGSWNPNFITDPTRIVSILNDIAHQQSALMLYPLEGEGVEKADEAITAYLYRVGTERAALRKVEEAGNDLKIRSLGRFKAVAEIFERVLSFRLEVVDVQQEGEQEYYIIKIPDRMYCPEQEPLRRARFFEQQKIPVYLRFFEPAKILPGLLDDLSLGGLGVILSGDDKVLPYVRKGDELQSCSIGLGNRQYRFNAQVTQVRHLSDKSLRLECKFQSLESGLAEAIRKLVDQA